MTGAERIARERQRQHDAEGYLCTHDDTHTLGELALAAICYAAPRPIYIESRGPVGTWISYQDPWPDDWHDNRPHPNPRTWSATDRIRALEKAGALIAAEIDRLLRTQPAADAAKETT